ncbi:uncharacterized protein B0P05DRAFT_536522 [Gilbertella persicaria]|uniref:uncharacterized protein n=1 Tax=Gilbertella persicaria TaxID=101096 RepID=UPI00221F9341|nr:uncharacterized protein B0P05DRAFT_536522 [Gilbertella persicaria]KAI8083212.1 hypothetical protein B0P05DRAFT_536522 [Gilbertella persicaria]
MSFSQLVFFSLTPEDSPLAYEDEQEACKWIDDSECQENLSHIVSLTPEESIIDKDNHIHSFYQLFFEELGYLTEEPEPIDPNRDYNQEAKDLMNQRDKRMRQKHVDLSRLPSLESSSQSGVSSSSSSIHHESHIDIRSPYYYMTMHCTASPYHYGVNHRPSRIH